MLLAASVIQSFAQQVVSGVASGAIYASLALALVLIYRAMDVANFAQGEMAMFATFVAYTLITQFHLPYLLAFVLTILLAFAGGVIVERAVVRPFEGAPVLTLVIVTLALFSIGNGLAGLIWGYVFKSFDSPFRARSVHVPGALVRIPDLGVRAVTRALLAVVSSFLRCTRLGPAGPPAALYPASSRLL